MGSGCHPRNFLKSRWRNAQALRQSMGKSQTMIYNNIHFTQRYLHFGENMMLYKPRLRYGITKNVKGPSFKGPSVWKCLTVLDRMCCKFKNFQVSTMGRISRDNIKHEPYLMNHNFFHTIMCSLVTWQLSSVLYLLLHSWNSPNVSILFCQCDHVEYFSIDQYAVLFYLHDLV